VDATAAVQARDVMDAARPYLHFNSALNPAVSK
jgi:hypothetical protein